MRSLSQSAFGPEFSPRRIRRWLGRMRSSALSLAEVVIAIAILTALVWGAASFLVAGRVTTEKAGEQRKAAQVAMEQLERARQLPYASVVNANGTETVDGIVYSWTLTVTTAQADPSDSGSGYKQVKVSVTWPTPGTLPVVLSTGISQ